MRVELKSTGGLAFEAVTGGGAHRFVLDEIPAHGGGGKGPSPLDHLLAGVGGCLGTSMAICLSRVGVAIDSLGVRVDATHRDDEDPFSLQWVEEITVEIDVVLAEGEDEDMLDLCIESFKKYCTVTAAVATATPVVVSVNGMAMASQ